MNVRILVWGLLLGFCAMPAVAQGPKLENLLKAELQSVDGAEVIVSKVSIPANSSLAKHWHPGEEFVYVLEGTLVLWQQGKPEQQYGPGEVIKIPLKQIHTAITNDSAVTVLVLRVHPQGQPERVLVE